MSGKRRRPKQPPQHPAKRASPPSSRSPVPMPSSRAEPAPDVADASMGSGLSPDVAAALRSALPTAAGSARARGARTPTPPVATPPVPARTPDRHLQVSRWSCSAVDDVEPQSLGMTHWVDVPDEGGPEMLRVRFSGRRVGDGEPTSFSKDVVVGPVPAGVGRASVTSRANVPAGEWELRAVALDQNTEVDGEAPVATGRGKTMYAPVARVLAPGVRPSAWPGLVSLGTVVALTAQVLLTDVRDLPWGRLLAVSVLACLIGVVGAKVYYLLTHRGTTQSRLAAGMSIQGFVLAAISTLVLGSLAVGVPVGDALDVTTPGLLTGMAIGRLGCWFGGCCAGRPTASRWGLWSSDRVIGVRRIPVQFLESGMTATLALTTAALLVSGALDRGGTTFVVGIAAYTLGRQVLFPLRGIPRTTRMGRPVMSVLTSLAIILAIVADAAN